MNGVYIYILLLQEHDQLIHIENLETACKIECFLGNGICRIPQQCTPQLNPP